MTRYTQFHIDNLRTSAMVNLPVRFNGISVTNPNGKYWSEIGRHVLGLHDVRARLGTFTRPWGHDTMPVFAAPELKYISDSLATLLDRRASELLKYTKRIAVLWSGGIDSTTVLTALLKNTNNLDQLVVYLTQESIDENPEFYKNHIAGKIECRDTRLLDVTDEFMLEHILVHGDPGDCLFGPSMPMYRHLLESNRHRLPWRENRNLIVEGIANRSNDVDSAKWYVDKVSDNIEEVSMDIESISDWWWWHYYNLKWEFSMLRPFFYLKTGRAGTSAAILAEYAETTFYNTAYFQQWSYSNLGRLCHDTALHKMDAKQYIFEFDKNPEYLNNKRKVESVVDDILARPAYLDKDLKRYFPTDPGLQEAFAELLEQYTN